MKHDYGTAAQRKQRRQEGAQERQERYDALDHKDKMSRALARGHANTREMTRLSKEVAADALRTTPAAPTSGRSDGGGTGTGVATKTGS
jgi:hypothetical protein